ncbi:MAG: Wzz/FepE/Etk N-terminal domain-containing protein, partial [Rhodobacterales bacterium]|nr:Wzz/FepE/Etk N-terminal domain-containing protein [Rhodobacterales bacterium]
MTVLTTDSQTEMAEMGNDGMAQIFRTIWAGKLWIAFFTVLFTGIGVLIALSTPPTYQADALLQLEENSATMTLPSDIRSLAGGDPRSVTEIEILHSRLVLGQAVADTHLDWIAVPRRLPFIGEALNQLGLRLPGLAALRPYANGGEHIDLGLLEVPPQWIGEMMLLTITDEDATAFTVALPDGRIIPGEVDRPIIDDRLGFGLRVSELRGEPGREFIMVQIDEGAAIMDLRQRMFVNERGLQSNILELGLIGGDPDETERVLHAITQAYLRQNVSRSSAEAASSLEFIESQLPVAEAAVREAESRLNSYRQQAQAIDLGFEAQSLLTQIGSIETELQQLTLQEDELSQRYTTNHPTYQQLLNARGRLEERLAVLREEATDLPETQREMFNLTRDLELAREVYGQLLNRAQELNVLKASTIGNVRIVDTARTAPEPIEPRRARIVAMNLLLGGLIGIGFVFLRQWLRRGVQSAEQIDALGLLVFATINVAPQAENAHKRKGAIPILALSDPGDLAVEGFRSLRTSLHFAMMDA